MDDDEIFRQLYAPLRRFAAVVGPPEVEPDDLVQEALARTLRQTPLDNLDDPAVYLRRVIFRLASNDRRLNRRRREILARLGTTPEHTDDAHQWQVSELWRLPSDQRAVLYLHLIEDVPHDEIGVALGISAEASRARLSRGLKQLRISLHEEERT